MKPNALQSTASPAAEFDDIVIGAGSAGCAVAGLLAEDTDATVALLEAGPQLRLLTVPQPGLNGRRSYQPRGRGLAEEKS
ncbi:Oxidoreductase, GMC family [Cupriavidus necator H850]|uniref:GMC family oxidoreductase N-terminal domain-containing protein n=1 Tax=Cupriavidus necator TaxID=106590 RepID=UPI0002DD883A|nr:Oxidoreductase, GMC family [Cupriavidus necator H850]